MVDRTRTKKFRSPTTKSKKPDVDLPGPTPMITLNELRQGLVYLVADHINRFYATDWDSLDLIHVDAKGKYHKDGQDVEFDVRVYP